MRRLTTPIAVSLTGLLLLTACGGDADDAADDTSGGSGVTADEAADDAVADGGTDGGSEPTDGDTWRVELEDGSQLTVVLDVDDDDPAVAPFAAYREELGVDDEVVWITAEIDVPADVPEGQGTGRYLTFVGEGLDPIDDDPMDDTDGIVIADFACSRIDRWVEATTLEDAAALDDANATYLDLYGEDCANQTLGVIAASGETTGYVLVLEGGALPDFERILAGLAFELEPVG